MSGWTGGQYSLYRGILGTALFVRFATPFTYDAPSWFASRRPLLGFAPNLFQQIEPSIAVWVLAIAGGLLAALLAAGWWDRSAAVVLAYLVAAGLASHSQGDLGWWLLSLVLLLHAAQPPAPFGSWAARGRVDPAGDWWMRRSVRRVAWSATALVYAYHGTSGLVAAGFGGDAATALAPWLDPRAETALFPLTLGFAPLALLPRVRPVLWVSMLVLHLTWMTMGWGGGWHAPMILALGVLFEPNWVPARVAEGADTVFYDGGCALCHGFVRFLLAEDTGERFRFAPLGGAAFAAAVETGAEQHDRVPDSVVVHTTAGFTKVRSDAVLYLLARLGGLWRLLAWIGRAAPRPARDLVYDGVAKARYRLFGRRDDACPVIPRALAARFDD